jgi:hypothetical protein
LKNTNELYLFCFQVHVSYVEIYNEEIRDLLTADNRKLEIKGNHGAVAGLFSEIGLF